MIRRLLPLCFLAFIGPLLSSCGRLTAALYPTWTPQPTYTPYPTYTPRVGRAAYPSQTPYPTHTPQPTYTPYPSQTPLPASSKRPTTARWTPDFQCRELLAFFEAMTRLEDEVYGHQEQWSRWMDRVNSSNPPAPEAVADRLGEFADDLHDIRADVYAISPPPAARKAHTLYLEALEQKQRAITYFQGYNTTYAEADRAEGNAALATADRLTREYHYEIDDLWEECFGWLPTATP